MIIESIKIEKCLGRRNIGHSIGPLLIYLKALEHDLFCINSLLLPLYYFKEVMEDETSILTGEYRRNLVANLLAVCCSLI